MGRSVPALVLAARNDWRIVCQVQALLQCSVATAAIAAVSAAAAAAAV